MGAASFTGLLFLGCGPLAVVFVLCLASKSFLVLLALGRCAWWGGGWAQPRRACFPPFQACKGGSLRALGLLSLRCSAFYWLCTLLLISALFRGEQRGLGQA